MKSSAARQSLADANLLAYFRSRKAPGPLRDLKSGERVGYTRYFLLSIRVPPTDPLWVRFGTIIQEGEMIVRIRWDDGTESNVATSNVARKGPNLRWCE